MQATIEAVAFDLDGLMFDTEALFFRVACETLEARGGRFTHEMMAAMIGRRAVEAGHVLQAMGGVDAEPEELLADVRGRYLAVLDVAAAPNAGLMTLLDRLDEPTLPSPMSMPTLVAMTTLSRLPVALNQFPMMVSDSPPLLPGAHRE